MTDFRNGPDLSVVSALVRLRLKNLEFKYVSQSGLYNETVWREGEATGHLQRVPPERQLGGGGRIKASNLAGVEGEENN